MKKKTDIQINEDEDGAEVEGKDDAVVDVNALIDNLPKDPYTINQTLKEVRGNINQIERQFFIDEIDSEDEDEKKKEE